MTILNSRTATVVVGAAVVVAFGATTAGASSLITGAQIKNNTIQSRDIQDGGVRAADLAPGAVASLKSAPAFKGAYYSVAYYDAGDTNAGAIATVACKSPSDVAISGGVQTLGLDADANSRNTPVSSSFPGRMDWSTNSPEPGRLDGWIVQFGGNAGATSDKDPAKTKVYALCVPGANIPVQQTYLESSD